MTPDTVLVVTASYDVAAEYVVDALRRRGTRAFRLDTDLFPSRFAATFRPPSDITFGDKKTTLSGDRVKSVWYRRHVRPELPEELSAGVRDFCEREVRAFLDGVLGSLQTDRWMSSPVAIARAERKPFQLAVASQLGFQIPETVMSSDAAEVVAEAGKHRLVAKAISSGYVASPDGNRAIFTSTVRPQDLAELDGLSVSPVTFQQLIDKTSDIRVTVVGEEAFAAEILSQGHPSSRTDWRATEDPFLPHRVHNLPPDIEALCLRLVNTLGLVFGAIDLALKDDGSYVFFEINPNGEWLWIEDQLAFPISDRIAQWLDA